MKLQLLVAILVCGRAASVDVSHKDTRRTAVHEGLGGRMNMNMELDVDLTLRAGNKLLVRDAAQERAMQQAKERADDFEITFREARNTVTEAVSRSHADPFALMDSEFVKSVRDESVRVWNE